MKKSKKADKAVKTEVFKIATAGLTKKLIQNVSKGSDSECKQGFRNSSISFT